MTVSDVIEVNPVERLPPRLRRLVDIGADPRDDPPLRLRKRMLVMIVATTTTAIAVALAATIAVGDPRSTVAPLVYGALSVLGMVHLAVTHRIELLLYSQLAMVLLLPALAQWLLGGFVASAVSVLYSMNAAVLAVVLVGVRQARWWFVAFVAVVGFSGLIDGWLVATIAPPDVSLTLFFVVTIVVVALLAWLPLAFFVESRRRLVAELDAKNVELDRERQRSEALLLNILPSEVAIRLKDGERPIADRFPAVAVLFSDFVGFTPTSEAMSPDEVIEQLNAIFTRFDRLASAHGLEKVKTIGDAYMVVAGAPEPRSDAVERLTRMAHAMRRAASDMTFGGRPLSMRIGMDVGPVVAGVIGESRFAWDLYGDAVNTASRMESHGVPGEIQVTERFREMLPAGYPVVQRPPIQVKGKGTMTTFVLGDPATPTE